MQATPLRAGDSGGPLWMGSLVETTRGGGVRRWLTTQVDTSCPLPWSPPPLPFESHTLASSLVLHNAGWPAFYDNLPGAVERHVDNSFGMRRVEITCSNCGGHLGHVFEGGCSRICVVGSANSVACGSVVCAQCGGGGREGGLRCAITRVYIWWSCANSAPCMLCRNRARGADLCQHHSPRPTPQP